MPMGLMLERRDLSVDADEDVKTTSQLRRTQASLEATFTEDTPWGKYMMPRGEGVVCVRRLTSNKVSRL